MAPKPVIVTAYDPLWPADFAAIAEEIRACLGNLALAIHHVGSTSVPGLAAKPIIDLDVVIAVYTVFPVVVEKLAGLGFMHEGNLGIPCREAFCYREKPHLRKHHMYVCPADSPELKRHLAFRDYLRSHPDAAENYSRVKQEAAALYPQDIDGYIRHKSPMIEEIYAQCVPKDEA